MSFIQPQNQPIGFMHCALGVGKLLNTMAFGSCRQSIPHPAQFS